jgi:hypothetical protein
MLNIADAPVEQVPADCLNFRQAEQEVCVARNASREVHAGCSVDRQPKLF